MNGEECVCINPHDDLSLRLKGGSPAHSGTSKYDSLRRKYAPVYLTRENQYFFMHWNVFIFITRTFTRSWELEACFYYRNLSRNLKDYSTAETFSGTQKCQFRNLKLFWSGTFQIIKPEAWFYYSNLFRDLCMFSQKKPGLKFRNQKDLWLTECCWLAKMVLH